MSHVHAGLRATRRLGDYEILYELKSGGMGAVLLARKLGAGGFEKLVAVKTIRSELRARPELRAMFLDEARLLARLEHPAIAQVFDFGEQDDDLFLAMEYVGGIHFRQLAASDPPPAIAARAMSQVCRGLHAAHELSDLSGSPLGVVHRDVSPENLMLTFEGRVKVLDFGIALMRGRTAPVTEFGTIKGKPPYLSPEQIKNEPVDRRTDIFSVCVVLHELLTGEPVYEGDSVYAVARAIECDDVEPPSASAGELPAGLDEVVMRGLEREPAARYQTALELAEALEAIAVAAGAQSLEAYAATELAADREIHRLWLHRLLSGEKAGAKPGRASGILTAQAAAGELAPEPRELADDLDSIAMERAIRGPRWGLFVVACLLLAGMIGAVMYVMSRQGDESSAASAPVDAGGAGAVAVGAGMDAGFASGRPDAGGASAAAGIVDAGSKIVAKGKPRSRGGVSGRRKPPDKVVRPPPARVDAAVPSPQPAKTERGLITVAADPYALVRIDGREIGTTPIFRRPIPIGKHEVVLVSPDTGELRLKRTVEIETGKLRNVIAR